MLKYVKKCKVGLNPTTHKAC